MSGGGGDGEVRVYRTHIFWIWILSVAMAAERLEFTEPSFSGSGFHHTFITLFKPATQTALPIPTRFPAATRPCSTPSSSALLMVHIWTGPVRGPHHINAQTCTPLGTAS